MKGFLRKGGFLLLILLVWSLTTESSIAQTLKFPEDLVLSCGDPIPPADPAQVQYTPGQICPNPDAYDCCSDKPLTPADGCFVSLDECLQIALVCIDKDIKGYPIFKFKVYNNCGKDLSNITFSLPFVLGGSGDMVAIPQNGQFVPIRNGANYTTCDRRFKVEVPQSGPDARQLKFEGTLPKGRSACFEYKVLMPAATYPNNKIVVRPKLGTEELEIEVPTTFCLGGTPAGIRVEISDSQQGNRCSGLIVKRTFRVFLPPSNVPVTHVQTITIPGDTDKPTGSCPAGATNLTSKTQIPSPNSRIGEVKARYQDNCDDDLTVTVFDTREMGGNCGEFAVMHTYEIKDDCGNKAYCTITYKGKSSGSGSITGACPGGSTTLQCFDDVPTMDELRADLLQRFQGADGQEVSVQISTEKSTGNDCGFWVKYLAKITDNCGNSTTCSIVYEGKDTKKPTGPCPSGKTDLTSPGAAPDLSSYFQQYWTDNCGGPIKAYKKQADQVETGACGEFKVLPWYVISDKCNNIATCEVVHYGKSNTSGGLTGACPEGRTDLQCLSQVPTKEQVIQLVKEKFQNETNVTIKYRTEDGDNCSGFTVMYEVLVTGPCGEEKLCWISYKGKDTTAPTLKPNAYCPAGKSNLTHPGQAPNPNDYMWPVKEAYEDNCGGPVYVSYVSQEVKQYGACGEFKVIQKFKVYDKCWNTTFCYVEHSGQTGGELIGECPPGKSDLQCLDEVPSDNEVIALVKAKFQNEKEVKIWEKWKEGSECGGFKVTFQVMITGLCGETKTCYIIYKGKDTTPPSLKPYASCPAGKDNLSSLSQVPAASQYMWPVKEAYEDNCGGPVTVSYLGQDVYDGDCGVFKVIQKFKITDQCGNAAYCQVIHKGQVAGGNLSGTCPEGKSDLQCLDEVPTDSEVIALVKAKFQNEKEVKIWEKWKEGGECGGFKVTFQVMITGLCGETQTCYIVYKGKDTTAPTGVCPAGLSDLSDISKVPHSSVYLAKVKSAYSDNCGGPVTVTFLGQSTQNGNCGAFTVKQRYKVADACGNSTTCEVIHSGGGSGGGSITGVCPPDKKNLICKDEIPTAAAVAALVKQSHKGADGGPVNVVLEDENRSGSECAFTVMYQYLITDNCGNQKTCTVTYASKDTEAPEFTSELPDLVIGCGETPTFATPTAVDGCGGNVTIQQVGQDLIVEGDCEASYSVIRTWVAKDDCGNVSEPVSQTITIPGDCCQVDICAYTPGYWGNHREDGAPNVKAILDANGGKITIGTFDLDLDCIDVLLPGAPLATPDNLEEFCAEGLVSTSQIRHTIALTLNTLNQPALCDVLLKNLPCPIDFEMMGFDDESTVCDLLEAANTALVNEWFDCELADALAAVNECFDCLCVPAGDDPSADTAPLKGPAAPAVHSPALAPATTPAPEPAQQLDLDVFPNPSSGLVNLNYAGFETGRVWVFIHNSAGDLVFRTLSEEQHAARLSLDLAGSLKLTGGAYFVTVTNGRQTVSRKLILSYQR